MAALPKMTRWLLLLADLILLASLALHRLEGGFSWPWPLVLLGVSVLNLAFLWEGIVQFARQ